MMFDSHVLIYFIIYTAAALEKEINTVDSNELQRSEESHVILPKDTSIQSERVSIDLYYETFCPYCVDFYTTSFVSVVEKLGPYLNITTIPYGNAKTIKRKGKYKFTCQHGPEECYGNKLHACAIDILQNITKAILFNSCMMKTEDLESDSNSGSNDEAADECGTEQNIDACPIKDCAKGSHGSRLLKKHGDASKKVNLDRVPSVMVDGNKIKNRRNFMRLVCAAFTDPPPPCKI